MVGRFTACFAKGRLPHWQQAFLHLHIVHYFYTQTSSGTGGHLQAPPASTSGRGDYPPTSQRGTGDQRLSLWHQGTPVAEIWTVDSSHHQAIPMWDHGILFGTRKKRQTGHGRTPHHHQADSVGGQLRHCALFTLFTHVVASTITRPAGQRARALHAPWRGRCCRNHLQCQTTPARFASTRKLAAGTARSTLFAPPRLRAGKETWRAVAPADLLDLNCGLGPPRPLPAGASFTVLPGVLAGALKRRLRWTLLDSQ